MRRAARGRRMGGVFNGFGGCVWSDLAGCDKNKPGISVETKNESPNAPAWGHKGASFPGVGALPSSRGRRYPSRTSQLEFPASLKQIGTTALCRAITSKSPSLAFALNFGIFTAAFFPQFRHRRNAQTVARSPKQF